MVTMIKLHMSVLVFCVIKIILNGGFYMKNFKKVFGIMLMIFVISIAVTVPTKAASLKATDVVKKVNTQISKAKSLNLALYSGKITSSKLAFKTSINGKKKIQYNDMTKMGLTKTYYYKNKMYWYNKADKKWYYQNVKSMPKTSYNNKITSSMKCSLLADKKFNGKKCIVLQVVSGDETLLYYLNKSTKEWIGMESDGYFITVDTKKALDIPAKVLKAKKKKYSF